MALVGTTKLKLYNAALIEVGDRIISGLTENVESRRILDEVYDRVLEECLSEGSWNFSIRPIKVDADTAIEPNFGFTEIFAKPTDWVKTTGVSLDDRWTSPLTHYHDDLDYWAADATPIYVRYVSNDASYGLNLSNWPASYTRYVELSLAHRILPRLSQDDGLKERIYKDLRGAKRRALQQDAMNTSQPKFFPINSWTASRGRMGTRSDRGNRGSFTG